MKAEAALIPTLSSLEFIGASETSFARYIWM
jgi:hypothetical protein